MRKETVIDKDKLFKEIGYDPHSGGQQQFHDSTARFRVACCGRRWGKSLSAGHDLTAYMFTPDAYYWIVGPNYSLGEKEFRVVYNDLKRKLFKYTSGKLRSSYNVKQGDMRIEMPWNTVLEVKSAEKPDGLVGEGLDGVVMSEAAKHKMSTWQQYIEPALADKRGFATFPSTPQGYNWFKGLFDLGQDDEYEDYHSWRFPSWTNPIAFPGGRQDPEILRLEKTSSPLYFDQEIGAEFTAFTGKIYTDFQRDVHVKPIQYNPFWKNYLAFDYGYTNPFVCLDIMVDPSDNVYIWREYQLSYLSTFSHGQYLKNRSNPEGYHIDAMFGDPRGPDEAATLALMLGPVVSNDVPWIVGIELIRQWLKPDGPPHLWIDPSCTELIRQMEMLRSPEGQEGKKNATEGQIQYDDHGPDALRYFFGQYFHLGGGSLADLMQSKTESETYFQYVQSGFRL
jgi:hypothetical protein